MARSDDLRLQDMRDACARISSIVARGRKAFDEDEAVLPAIERWLEILGEAATYVGEEGRRQHPDVEWAAVTKLRIRLAHHYHRVSSELVWSMATRDVPRLVEALGDGESTSP